MHCSSNTTPPGLCVTVELKKEPDTNRALMARNPKTKPTGAGARLHNYTLYPVANTGITLVSRASISKRSLG